MDEKKLYQLVEDVAFIKGKITNWESDPVCSLHSKQIEDQESRIRALESFRGRTIGAILAAQFLFTTVLAVLLKVWE